MNTAVTLQMICGSHRGPCNLLGYENLSFDMRVPYFPRNELPVSFVLKMEASGSSDMLVPMYQVIWLHSAGTRIFTAGIILVM